MKYIKTYERFDYKPVNEEIFGIFNKIKEMIKAGREVVDKLVNQMTNNELKEALEYAYDKGLTPELAKKAADKLKLETPEEAATQLEDVVEPIVNESIFSDVKDRIIRFIGMPALTGFLGWITSILLRASATGWASEPQWIIDIHDKIGSFGGPLGVLGVILTFILFIVTIAKMKDKNIFKA